MMVIVAQTPRKYAAAAVDSVLAQPV